MRNNINSICSVFRFNIFFIRFCIGVFIFIFRSRSLVLFSFENSSRSTDVFPRISFTFTFFIIFYTVKLNIACGRRDHISCIYIERIWRLISTTAFLSIFFKHHYIRIIMIFLIFFWTHFLTTFPFRFNRWRS